MCHTLGYGTLPSHEIVNQLTDNAPQSSNLGIVSHLIGATFIFEVIRDIWIFPEVSSNLKYVTAE